MSSIIDLTAIDESPPSLPRPTIAGHPIEPRRRLRDGSSSSSYTHSTRSRSNSVGMMSFGGGGSRRRGRLEDASGGAGIHRNNRRGRESSRVGENGLDTTLGLGISMIKEDDGNETDVDDDDGVITGGEYSQERIEMEGPSGTGTSATSMTTIPETSQSPPSTSQRRKRKPTSRSRSDDRRFRRPPQPIPISSDSDSPPFEVLDPPSPLYKLDKGKGKAKEITPEPEEDRLIFFQCPICLGPPMQAVLTPCGHIMCAACLLSSLKSQAMRDSRKPLPIGTYPTQQLSGKKIKPIPGRKQLIGRILQGNCPVCRVEIEGGMSTEPGEGGVNYLEPKEITRV